MRTPGYSSLAMGSFLVLLAVCWLGFNVRMVFSDRAQGTNFKSHRDSECAIFSSGLAAFGAKVLQIGFCLISRSYGNHIRPWGILPVLLVGFVAAGFAFGAFEAAYRLGSRRAYRASMMETHPPL